MGKSSDFGLASGPLDMTAKARDGGKNIIWTT